MNQNTQTTTPWANPTPAGLVALAVACFGFFAVLSGSVGPEAAPLLGCWLLGGFVIQFVVGLLDLKAGNGTGGNTFLFFSAFFMLVGGIEMLYKFGAATNGVVLDARIDGWAWAVLTLVIWLWTPAFFKSPLPLTLIVFCLDVALPFIALADMAVIPKSWTLVSAWGLLLAGLFAIYLSGAMVLNNAFSRQVLPMSKTLLK